MLSKALRRRPPVQLTHNAQPFSTTSSRGIDYTHAVIGGGVVGLSVARALAKRAASTPASSSSVLLLERHDALGTETSSRNSEVIHAGIYYGRDSLKTQLCIRGRELLYGFCGDRAVPHRRTGKWIVAQTTPQREALERIHELCQGGGGGGGGGLGVPVRWVSREEARRREPDVRAQEGVLESAETGIVDSHALMLALQADLEDTGAADVALFSRVVGLEPLPATDGGAVPGSSGWELRIRNGGGGGAGGEEEESTITAETIINAAGLGAVEVHNMIVPPRLRLDMFYAKGNYFSYSSPRPRVSTLIYPAPEPGHAGLGTHLTLDLAGRIRFGPDVEWVDSPDDLGVNPEARLPEAVREIRKYLPGIDERALAPDYAGIRPKLGGKGAGAALAGSSGFVDFVVRKEDGFEGWVNLLGIESPGLTSCLAIGEMVEGLLYRQSGVGYGALLGLDR